MYEFLSLLIETALPRLRDFNGVHYVQNEKSGSINFGFPSSVMVLFPQLERTFYSICRLI
jgi:ribosomal protein L5